VLNGDGHWTWVRFYRREPNAGQVIKLKERTFGRLRAALAVVAILVVIALALGYLVLTSGAQQSPSVKGNQCYISVEGYAIYLRVLSDDSRRPVVGAEVSGMEENMCGPQSNGSYRTSSQPIYPMFTPPNGTLLLTPAFEHYDVTVRYSGSTYSFTLSLAPTKILNATLYFPSGKLNTTTYSP
jgi:hypothetical protein